MKALNNTPFADGQRVPGRVHAFEMHIEPEHIDASEHVNNAVYLSLLERARWAILEGSSFDRARVHASGFAPVLIDCTLKFRRELRLGEKIRIESQVLNVQKNMTLEMKQVIYNEKGDRCLIGNLRQGVFDLKTRELSPLTHEWLKCLL